MNCLVCLVGGTCHDVLGEILTPLVFLATNQVKPVFVNYGGALALHPNLVFQLLMDREQWQFPSKKKDTAGTSKLQSKLSKVNVQVQVQTERIQNKHQKINATELYMTNQNFPNAKFQKSAH
jgi:hypothetical protein